MSTRKKAAKPAVADRPRARGGRSRQRQRLIDACISALHIYGPSHTTVEKVVAIAKMSPGIVRFYFDSKAAMLVASLQFLSAEFEDQVLVPVTKLKAQPVVALQRMVDLYLDPDIASPRKVSVWYAFWGEASSRQEYYDICGQKDESSAALVQDLIRSLIARTAQPHLDADAIALGLIGVLEILWQDIAFQTERDVDRPAAKRRCMAYLRSVFPREFSSDAADADDSIGANGALPAGASVAPHLPGWAYSDSRLWAMERETLFRPAWTIVGHESQLPHGGDYITLDTGLERVLLVRDRSGIVRALRNSCPEAPHALVDDLVGHLQGAIECPKHGLSFSWEGVGRHRGLGAGTAVDLRMLDFRSLGGLLWIRSASGGAPEAPLEVETAPGLMMLGPPLETTIAADWKVLVEQWLEGVPRDAALGAAAGSVSWDVALPDARGWSAGRYIGLMACLPEHAWRRQFVAPHQLLEARPDGLMVLQLVPTAPGRTLLRRFDYSALPPENSARASLYLAQRLGAFTRRSTRRMAESVQRGVADYGYEPSGGASASAPAVDWFHALLAQRLPAAVRGQPPAERQISL